jgi:hypothetical protein
VEQQLEAIAGTPWHARWRIGSTRAQAGTRSSSRALRGQAGDETLPDRLAVVLARRRLPPEARDALSSSPLRAAGHPSCSSASRNRRSAGGVARRRGRGNPGPGPRRPQHRLPPRADGEAVYARPAERGTELHRTIAAASRSRRRAGGRSPTSASSPAYGDALAASVTAGLEASRVYAFAEARVHLTARSSSGTASRRLTDAAAQGRLLTHAAQAARSTGDNERSIALCEALNCSSRRGAGARGAATSGSASLF